MISTVQERLRLASVEAADPSPVVRQVVAGILDYQAEQIPADVRHFAGLLLLDTLGVAAAAHQMAPARIARRTAEVLYGAGAAAPAACLLFDGGKVSVAGAVFAGAAQIDNLDGHDGCNPTKGHIGVVVVPALLAFAQSTGRRDAGEALAALVLGYEIGARAAIALHATTKDYHSSGAWNALAVAAIGARLRNLSAAQLREALGIAEYHGPRSQMMRVIDHPTMLRDGSSWGGLAGASAVFLAEFGYTGAPALTLEAPDVEAVWQDFGRAWFVLRHYIKPYPICRWAHPLVAAALQLRQQHKLESTDIASIEMATFAEAARLFQGVPTTSPVAQYASTFPVAAALVSGALGVHEIAGPMFDDPEVHRLVAASRVRESAVHSSNFPAHRHGEVTLVLHDGRRVDSGVVSAPGGPEASPSEAEIRGKFHAYAAPVIGKLRAQRLADCVMRLADRDGDVDALIELVCRRPET